MHLLFCSIEFSVYCWASDINGYIANQAESECKHSLTFRVRAMLPQQCNPCTDCKSAQQCTTRGHLPAVPPSYIRVRSAVWACGRRQTDRQTDWRAWPIYISRHLWLTRNV